MIIFQYWDAGDPPPDVAACIKSVRELNSELDHQLFDRDHAAAFIGERFGRRQRAAFLSLFVPAMQADYFRLCALSAKGGAWVDADLRCAIPLRSLFEKAPHGYLTMLDNRLQSSFLVQRKRGSHFFLAAIELATRHIEGRLRGTAYEVTGPHVLNLIWAVVDPIGAHQDRHLVRDQSVRPTSEARACASLYPEASTAFSCITRGHDVLTDHWLPKVMAAYKNGPRDWRNWQGPIYHIGMTYIDVKAELFSG